MPEPRYAGLTYASVAGDHGAGGWQVHDRSPGLRPEEEAVLADRVVTGFDSHAGSLPPFVEPELLAGLPVRFSAEPVVSGVLIRVANQAGADATGRPGNVFTTLLVDRDPDAAPQPIRLWRSPDLLQPFGAAAVAAARPVWSPRPGAVVDAAAVAGLLTDARCWAPLAVLLDAVAASVAGGPAVVLPVGDQDEAARWVGAACLLTAPAWSRRLRWSLYERGGALAGLGLHLAATAGGEAPAPSGELLVLDPAEQPALGVLGGSDHVTAHGSAVAVTPWSELVTELFALEQAEAAVLLDEVAAIGGPSAGPADGPAWWLALGLLGAPSCPADVAAAAAALLRRTAAPADLAPTHRAVLARAFDATGPGPLRDALLALAPADGRGAPLAARFVAAALADPVWLDGAEPASGLPAGAAEADPEQVAAALRAALDPAGGAVLLRRAANLADVLGVVGLLDAGDPRIDEPLSDLVLTAAAETGPDDAAALIALVNRLPEAVRAGILPMLAGLLPTAGPALARIHLPNGLESPHVLQLLEADGGGTTALPAADALLARGADVVVARRLGAALADGRQPMHEARALLHPERWSPGDRLAVAALAPSALHRDVLVVAIAEGGVEGVRPLDGVVGLPPVVADTVRLRLEAEQALEERHWRVGLRDADVLAAADRVVADGVHPASALLSAPSRLLPVIALLLRRFDERPGISALEQLLKRRTLWPRLDPLPIESAEVLADRVGDEDRLPAALAYAAGDRASVADDALRRGLATTGGDLLDLALEQVLPRLGERLAAVLEAAEDVYAERAEGRRPGRLLPRRSPVAVYAEGLGAALPRRGR